MSADLAAVAAQYREARSALIDAERKAQRAKSRVENAALAVERIARTLGEGVGSGRRRRVIPAGDDYVVLVEYVPPTADGKPQAALVELVEVTP